MTVKTAVVHTLTYVVAGVLAFTLMDYEKTFSEPPLSFFMRPTSSPWVVAGPLFQPIRGLIFALDHPEKRWLDWTLGVAFGVVMILLTLGLLAARSSR